jgi:hypothetical protein
MIDSKTETLLSFPQATKLFASYREGKPAHVSRLHCYRLYGYRGVRLDALRQGGQWVTSVEAIARFMADLTAVCTGGGGADHGQGQSRARTGSPDAARSKQLQRTEEELDVLLDE